jgi:hypothetical protein
LQIRLFLPRDVIVYQRDGGMRSVALDPYSMLELVRNPCLERAALGSAIMAGGGSRQA